MLGFFVYLLYKIMMQIIPFIMAAVLTQTDDNMYKIISAERMGMLSTSLKGTPFGSLTPFMLDKKGNPVLFLSDLAQHTENISKDKRCSLMIHRIDKDDIFNSPRVTFVGKMTKVTGKEREELAKLYLRKHPEAKDFIDFEDFNFYRLTVDRIHYIGGFGDINWIDADDYRRNLPKNR